MQARQENLEEKVESLLNAAQADPGPSSPEPSHVKVPKALQVRNNSKLTSSGLARDTCWSLKHVYVGLEMHVTRAHSSRFLFLLLLLATFRFIIDPRQ